MDNLLRTKVKSNYEGFLLQEIHETKLTEIDFKNFSTKLKTIPKKIAAFIKTEEVKQVYKYCNFGYYIVTKNNKNYELIY